MWSGLTLRGAVLALALVACSGSDKGTDTSGDDDDDNGGGLTEDEFIDQFYDVFCAEWESCTGEECPTASTTTSTTTDCDYDASAAQACLDGEWGCEDYGYGIVFPVFPDECIGICGTTTSTTTP